MSDIVKPEEITDLAAAIRELAGAIHNMAEALKADDMQEDKPVYKCEECGSPQWMPGGMGEKFRKCRDCGTLGGPVDLANDDEK